MEPRSTPVASRYCFERILPNLTKDIFPHVFKDIGAFESANSALLHASKSIAIRKAIAKDPENLQGHCGAYSCGCFDS